MKKTYLMPITEVEDLNAQSAILAGSPESGPDIYSDEAVDPDNADNNYGKSIWEN